MVANMDYYRAVRRENPSYSEYDAFKEWMRDNPDVAVELAKKIWPEFDPDTFPMDRDAMSSHLGSMEPLDVFYLGYFSKPNCDRGDEYYMMDEDGHFVTLSDRDYERVCVDFMCGWGYEEIAFDDRYPVPRELADVLALWGTAVRTENRRPTPKCKGGSCGRPVAKKVPTKKTGSANTKSKSTKSSNTKSKSVRSKTPAKRCRA